MKKEAKSFITTNPDKPYWVCTACAPAALEIGFIRGVGSLCYIRNVISNEESRLNDGAYVLVLLDDQGHRDGFIILSDKPKFKDKELSNYTPYDVSMKVSFSVNIIKAFEKYASKKDRINEYGWVYERWLITQMISLVERWERRFKVTVETYYRSFYAKKVIEFHKKMEKVKEANG